ncbi:MAG: DUF4383 domain-containing protein [Mycobacterium sp.]
MSTNVGRRYTPVQAAAFVVGAVFLLIGILGFIPGDVASRVPVNRTPPTSP